MYDVFIYIISLIDTISCEVESILLSLFYFSLQEIEVQPTKEMKNLGSVTLAGSKPTPTVTQSFKEGGCFSSCFSLPRVQSSDWLWEAKAPFQERNEGRKARKKEGVMGPSSDVLTVH